MQTQTRLSDTYTPVCYDPLHEAVVETYPASGMGEGEARDLSERIYGVYGAIRNDATGAVLP